MNNLHLNTVVEITLLITIIANYMRNNERKIPTNADDVVDALIDLCVVAIGTLDGFGVDSHKAWDAVLIANMNKEVGVKESRPNPLGLPDLIKPAGWVAPSHADNEGKLKEIF